MAWSSILEGEIKGGVWKNTEDEILKAAVMKYGKNQWARVASLMSRKSAKQCKARWYNWLDPSIKKTEWTREEEERLLHLAKLLPNQWRTIAPMIGGRTASQCLEHYERLLDQAQGDDLAVDPSADPRQLRPGEIEPNPESKAARPDPIDMDEDEKEMLSEARARLANTRGKKAKRKAREKQLLEARRLALLQKRRELKAAGFNMKLKHHKKGEMDYVTEVPFEKLAPAGFYDTSADDSRVAAEQRHTSFIGASITDLEGVRRDEEEERQRKLDKRRIEKLKKANLPAALALENAANDISTARKRMALSLPAPAVSDQELEEVIKLGVGAAGAGGGATQQLLGQYSATPAVTPMRTPMVSDVIMQEARNHLAMRSSETPLKGGDNPELAAGTGFSGVTPMRLTAAGSTPSLAMVAGTPRVGMGAGATPVRDSFSINKMGFEDPAHALNMQRRELARGFDTLPAPSNNFTLEVPEVPEDLDIDMEQLSEDAADVAARQAKARQAALDAEAARRSTVLKREPALPRPANPPTKLDDFSGLPSDLAVADHMIAAEMCQLLQHDAVTYPVSKSRRPRLAADLVQFSDQELAHARSLLAAEVETVKAEKGDLYAPEVLGAALDKAEQESCFVPSVGGYVPTASCTKAQLVESLEHRLAGLVSAINKDGKKITKLTSKANVLFAGHQAKAQSLASEITGALNTWSNNLILQHCYNDLKHQETIALTERMASAKARLDDVCQTESELQARYARLVDEAQSISAGAQ